MENELISASISDRGLSEKRPQNEDSFAELPQLGVFAVADGVGGANAGDFASRMAMELLTEAVSNRADTDAAEMLRTAITHANRSIHQTALELPQLSSMATTIVALHLKNNIATLAHVGDSRIYRITPEGQLFRETNDHSVVEEEVRAGRMTPEEALVHPSRNIISRALGAEENVEIDVKTIMVEPNTTFLLCSDGITRHIPDNELQSIFSNGAEPRMLCDQLKELCYSRGAEDNLTAVIVRTFAEGSEDVDDFDSTVQVLEEDTVASARTAYAAAAGENLEPLQPEIRVEDTISEIDLGEIETGDLEIAEAPAPEAAVVHEATVADVSVTEAQQPAEEPQFVEPLQAADTDEQYQLTETGTEQEVIEDPTPAEVAAPVNAVPAASTDPQREFSMFGSSAPELWEETGPSKSGAGRILISIGLLIVGGALAVGASYFLGFTGPQQVVQAPQIETMQSNNIPLTSFEELRRAVDKDPEGYLAKYAPSPEDASDFYLLGRANLLIQKPQQAKQQFLLAQQNLSKMADEKERKTLSNEIALGLAVVENEPAIASFKKSTESNTLMSNSNTTSTSNTIANTNSPIR
jgi:serine/threonine protein phosphatase PrpC